MPGRIRDPSPGVQGRQQYAVEPGRCGGPAGDYEDWTVDALRSRAAELGIRGRSRMGRDALIQALRAH